MDAFFGYATCLLLLVFSAQLHHTQGQLRSKIRNSDTWRINTSADLRKLRLVNDVSKTQYNFTRLTSLYHPNAVVFHDGERVRPVSSAAHYASEGRPGVVSLYEDGSADGVVVHGGSLHSLSRKEGDNESQLLRTLMDGGGHGGCGTNTDGLPDTRRLEVNEWKNCYPGQVTTRYLDIGIATDLGFLEANGGKLQSVLALVESAVAKTNEVFVAQFNILLRIAQVVVTSQSNEAPPLSMCEPSIQENLKRFSEWAGKLPVDGDQSVQPVQQGLWHLFTACYSPPGNIGMAYIQDGNGRLGTLCYHEPESLNVGVTSLTNQMWLTFAHEVGHNFGARHSFENGKGKTGGIMDYNVNGLFNGQVQFNSLRKAEICKEISNALASPLCTYERIEVSSVANSKSKGSERHALSGSFFTPFHAQCSGRESTGSCVRETGEAGACKNGLCWSLISELVFDGQVVPHQRVCASTEATSVQKKTLIQAHPKFGCQSMRNWIEEGSGEALYVLVSAGGSCSVLEKILYAKSAGFKGAVIVQAKGVGLNGATSACDASINGFVSVAVPWNVGVQLEEKLSRGYEVNVMYGPLAGAEASGYILHDPEIHQFVSNKATPSDDSESTFLLILISVLSCLAVFAAIHVLFLYGRPTFARGPSESVLPVGLPSESRKNKEKSSRGTRVQDDGARKQKTNRPSNKDSKVGKQRSKSGSASKPSASNRSKAKKESRPASGATNESKHSNTTSRAQFKKESRPASRAKKATTQSNRTSRSQSKKIPQKSKSSAVKPTGEEERRKKSSQGRSSTKRQRSKSKETSASKKGLDNSKMNGAWRVDVGGKKSMKAKEETKMKTTG